MERRLNAIDRIWRGVLALRNNAPQLMMLLDIITVDEYKGLTADPRLKDFAGDLSENRIAAMIPDKLIEETRPYIGERLWSLFVAYQAVTLRVLFLIHLAQTQHTKVAWFDDPGVRQLLAVALSQEELAEFDSARFGKISLLRRLMDSKIIQAATRVVSGEEFGAEAMRQAREILAATAALVASGTVPNHGIQPTAPGRS